MRTSLHDSWGMSLLYRHPRVDNKVNKDTKVDPKEPQVPLEVCVASLVEGAPASHLLRPGDIIRYERRGMSRICMVSVSRYQSISTKTESVCW